MKTEIKVSVHKGVAAAIRERLPFTSYTLSGFVENALIEKLRKDGVDIDAILRAKVYPVPPVSP